MRVDTIEDHIMHSEYAEVPQEVVDAVLAAKARGNRVIAVGTTSVRSLESAAQAAKRDLIEPFFGDTQIFIYPGYQYKVIDALITNFHLPESTLIMLVSAFAGYQHTMNAYKTAVEQKYRFLATGTRCLSRTIRRLFLSVRKKAISLAILTPGSARHPHVLRVRSGGCALVDPKLAAPMTPSGIY